MSVGNSEFQGNVASKLSQLLDVLLTNAANGDILYNNGTNWVNLPKGSGTQVLQTGTPPSWVNAAGGITESVEASQAGANVGGVTNTLAANELFAEQLVLNLNTHKYFKFTAIQWKNFATVSGNVRGVIFQMDAFPPVSNNITIVAQTASVAQAGASTTQKVAVQWSDILSNDLSSNLMIGIIPDNATATYSTVTVGSRNHIKILSNINPPPFDTTAWTSSGTEIADLTAFYKTYD